MRQYRITTENILQDSPDDCYLAPDDIVHQLKIAHSLGGLGSAAKLSEYNALQQPKINNIGNDNAAYMKEHNIKPGDNDWFRLWFSKPN